MIISLQKGRALTRLGCRTCRSQRVRSLRTCLPTTCTSEAPKCTAEAPTSEALYIRRPHVCVRGPQRTRGGSQPASTWRVQHSCNQDGRTPGKRHHTISLLARIASEVTFSTSVWGLCLGDKTCSRVVVRKHRTEVARGSSDLPVPVQYLRQS